MNSFFNTTDLPEPEVECRERKAKSQDVIILQLFQRNPKLDFTPQEVYDALQLNCPLTSIRRAITNLTNEGELTRTDKKRDGRYGMKTYCWRLKYSETLTF